MTPPRIDLTLVLLATVSCTKASPPTPTETPQTRAQPSAVIDAAPSPRRLSNASLTLAYPNHALSPQAFESLLTRVRETAEGPERNTLLFAAARRAPSTALARVWSLAADSSLGFVARGLAGRNPGDGPSDLPPALLARLVHHDDASTVATIVSRQHSSVPNTVPLPQLLTDADPARQLAGARLLTARELPLPEPATIEALPPFAIAPLARALAARPDTPTTLWVQLLQLIGQRAQLAPRLWANPWRALRDAVPTARLEIQPVLQSTTTLVSASLQTLPAATASALRCENATAIDKLAGVPAETLRCAAPGYRWMALAAQADVLGNATTAPGRRAGALATIVAAAQGDAHVLAAVAAAAVKLPVSTASSLLQRLSRERDPGVLASVLEALEAHPEHARALPATVRHDLLTRPFDLPEGPALEARVQALKLARRLGDNAVVEQARNSPVRAIQAALQPDAEVLARSTHDTMRSPSDTVALRVDTDAGSFEIELDPDAAPIAVAQFVATAQARRYDGLNFHRIVPGFVAQGGDPRGDGYGGTDNPTPTELSMRRFDRGAVGIPLAGLDTGGTQFFVVTADAPHLDGRYPYVGRVRRGIEVVDGLLVGDRIERVEVLTR